MFTYRMTLSQHVINNNVISIKFYKVSKPFFHHQKIANSKVEFLSMFLDCVEVIKGWLDKSLGYICLVLGRDRLKFLELEHNLWVRLNQVGCSISYVCIM